MVTLTILTISSLGNSFCKSNRKSEQEENKSKGEDAHGYIVSFGGLFGNNINKGETIIPFIEDKQKLLDICDAAITFFAENAKPGERFKYTIDRIGRDVFAKKILEASV